MKKLVIGVVIVAVVALGLGWYLFSQTAQAPAPSVTTENVAPVSTDPNVKNLVIDPSQSKAIYEIDEKLQGKQVHVVGTSQTISGQVTVNLASPASIKIGTVKVDANTFRTDIGKRDENVRELVLKSTASGNQYITFEPVTVKGVPATIKAGESFPVTIDGNMTIMQTTKPVSFTGTASLSADNVLKIDAKTTITYEDFGVKVPNFSFLSNVAKTTDLTVNIVAK